MYKNGIAQGQKKIEELNEYLFLATNNANIATWEWDMALDTLTKHNLLEEMFGTDITKGTQGVFSNWLSILHPDDREPLRHQIRDIIDHPQKKLDIKFRITRPENDMITVRSIANIQRNEKGQAIKMVGICMDITKEDEIDRAKSEFVSLASHQLRTPLTSIKWNAEMLLSGNEDPLKDRQRMFVQEISTNAERMNLLVNALLNVSRIELGTFSIDPVPTNLRSVIESLIRECESVIREKHLNIHTFFDETIPTINLDPKFTAIIIKNLLSNAIKYTPKNGKIECELKKEKENVSIRVTDTGIGIPKAQQSSIFKKLFRADNAKEIDTNGTGLGLYIVKSILDYSGGAIRFHSKIGEGSTFVVTLPLNGMQMKQKIDK